MTQPATHLMGSANQVHIVFLKEPRYNIGTECKRYTTVIF